MGIWKVRAIKETGVADKSLIAFALLYPRLTVTVLSQPSAVSKESVYIPLEK